MQEYADKIQRVINTLATIQLPATFDNADRIMGIYSTLCEVRDGLTAAAKGEESDGEGAGV